MEKESNPISSVSRSWKWTMAFGAVLVIMGWVAWFNPFATTLATGAVIAAALTIGGVMSIAAAFNDGGWGERIADVLFGALALLAAFFAFASPVMASLSLIWALGAMFLASAILELVGAFRAEANRGWLFAAAAIDGVIGVGLLLMNPVGAWISLVALVGTGFILRGLLLIANALTLRNDVKHVKAAVSHA